MLYHNIRPCRVASSRSCCLPCRPPPRTAPEAAPEATLPDLVVEAQRAAAARQGILARFGSRETVVERETIEALPGGAAQPLNQVLLQTPGVVQDSFGEVHVRGEHRNLQYRLNGVALPESLSGFGQVFDARALRSVSVLTGALPAQFGFRTNAVIDLETRSGALDPGGAVGVQGGSRGTLQPYANWAGFLGGWDVFATGTFLRSDQGIENPTSSFTAINGQTQQTRGLAYAARQLDDTTRLSVIAGTSLNRFRIPVTRGVEPEFTAFGLSDYDSAALRARQWERSWYGTAAVQKSWGDVDLQVAPFIRSSSIHYVPSVVGETVINGVASDVYRGSLAMGTQADAAWRVAADHTLRAGFQFTGERARFRSATTVLPLDGSGNAIDDPLTLSDRFGRTGWLYGGYVQDEWRLGRGGDAEFGVRWDQMVEYVTAGQVSPRVNLVWRPTGTTTLHAGYARTFTPPQFELVQGSTIAQFQAPPAPPPGTQNDPVRPERAHRFDAGVSQRLGERLTVGIDAYYKDVRDLLDFGQFGNALIFTPFNYERGKIYGVEFSGNGGASAGWSTAICGQPFRRPRHQLGAVHLRSGGAGLYRRQVCPHRPRPAADRLGRRGWKGWDDGRLAASMLYGNGLRRGFANSEKMAPYASLQFRRGAGFPDPGRRDVDRAARPDQRVRHRLPAARRQRDRGGRAAIRAAADGAGGVEPGVLRARPAPRG